MKRKLNPFVEPRGGFGEALAEALENKRKIEAIAKAKEPRSVQSIMHDVRDYLNNIQKFIDYSKPIRHRHGEITFACPSMADALGLEYLNGGHYSDVYRVSDKYVLKVNKAQHENGDNGYASFVRFMWAEGHKYSCFPAIYAEEKSGKRGIYLLENLSDRNGDDDGGYSEKSFLASIAYKIVMGEHGCLKYLNLPDNFKAGLMALAAFYNNENRTGYLSTDFKADNMMFRPSTGQVVITDPFC